MSAHSSPWRALLPAVEEIAARAAERLRRALFAPLEGEAERAPIDAEVEALIARALAEAAPHCGFRGEERPALWRPPSTPDGPFFLVDPNDGTSAFQAGQRGASISIALIAAGEPVLGVVLSYGARGGAGDLFSWAEGLPAPLRNGAPLELLSASDACALLPVMVSNGAATRAEGWDQLLGPGRWRPAPGIAYRLALCAAGEASAALSTVGARDFDVAGGDALLRGVGGRVEDEEGRALRYHFEPTRRTQKIYAGPAERCAELRALPWHQLSLTPPTPGRLLAPSRAALVDEVGLLRAALGGWWGARLGEQLAGCPPGEDEPLELTAERSAALADLRSGELRAALRIGASAPRLGVAGFASRLLPEAPAQRSTLAGLLSAHSLGEAPRAHRISEAGDVLRRAGLEPREPDPLRLWGALKGRTAEEASALGALLGALLGARGEEPLPLRWRSKTLADYQGPVERWQGDGERLVEACLAAKGGARARAMRRTSDEENE